MFSVQQKRDISDAVQKILRATAHAELPTSGEISFTLHVDGAEDWSWADIQNNGAVGDPGVNPHNELMASVSEEEGRGLIEQAKKITGDTPDPRATPEEFYKEMLDNQFITLKEDNQSLHTRIESLETAIKQLGTGQLLKKDPKKCPDCGVVEGDEHAPDCTALEVKNTIGDA